MNDRTEYRIKQTLIRSKKLCRQKEQRLVRGGAALCVALTVCLLTTINIATANLPHVTSDMGFYGAVLLLGDADIYILTAALAFIAGCIVTFLCIQSQNKKKQNKTKTEEDDPKKE